MELKILKESFKEEWWGSLRGIQIWMSRFVQNLQIYNSKIENIYSHHYEFEELLSYHTWVPRFIELLINPVASQSDFEDPLELFTKLSKAICILSPRLHVKLLKKCQLVPLFLEQSLSPSLIRKSLKNPLRNPQKLFQSATSPTAVSDLLSKCLFLPFFQDPKPSPDSRMLPDRNQFCDRLT